MKMKRVIMAAMVLAVTCAAPAGATVYADEPSALAQGVSLPPVPDGLPAEAEADPLDAVVMLVLEIQGGSWLLAAALALALAVALLRRVAGRWAWAQTDRGGAVIAGLCGLLGSLAVVLSSGSVPSPSALFGAVAITWAAVGARQWLRRLLWPADGGTPWLEWLQDIIGWRAAKPVAKGAKK